MVLFSTVPAHENFHINKAGSRAEWIPISATSQILASLDDRFSMDFDLGFKVRKLVPASRWHIIHVIRRAAKWPWFAMDFINANATATACNGSHCGRRNEFWQVPATPGRLPPRTKQDPSYADDFTVSQMTSQLRYRWEIALLSDEYLYRGSNLPYQYDDDFAFFVDAFNQPIIDTFTIKLRYRFRS